MRKFYPSTSASRVHNFFADQLLCAPDVAAKLTCYQGGLPTGSPLSPILSLYANKPMFESLNRLALTHALKFTCYVDDLPFSGDALPRGLTAMVTNIIEQYGHLISIGKTRIFRRNQSKHVTGVVLFKNSIHVPHGRFLKARAISAAIKNTKLPAEWLLLTEKLAGLLSEVAFLDSQFLAWAKRTYIAEKNGVKSIYYENQHRYQGDRTRGRILQRRGIVLWWEERKQVLSGLKQLVINLDNRPECNGHRSQFLLRMTEFADMTGLCVRLVYYPPYHSKYNGIERYWAGLEKSWNGCLLGTVDRVLNRAGNFFWKGVCTVARLLDAPYEKGVKVCGNEKIKLGQRRQALPYFTLVGYNNLS